MKRLSALIMIIFAAPIMFTGCTSALQNAAERGQTETVKKLLDDGADINENKLGYSPLNMAIAKGNIETVKFLLDKGADINKTTYCRTSYGASLFTPLQCAVANSRIDIAQLLLDRGAAGVTPLHRAAAEGQIDKVKNLLDKGADVNAEDHYGHTPLINAAVNGRTDTVKLLLEKGANIYAAIAYLENDAIKNPGGSSKAGLKLLEKFTKKEEPVQTVPTGSQASLNNGESQPSSFIKSDVDELPAALAKSTKNSYAIVVGIENYRQKLPKADFALSDALLVSKYLAKVMGYPEENIVTLTNEKALKSDLEKYFGKWLANNVEEDGRVFIYYSGHGAPNPITGDAYLVPYDGDPAFISETGYPLRRLYDALAKLPAKEIVIALDSCFSGAGGRSVIAKGARPLVMNLQNNMYLPKNMMVLSASSGEQISSTYDEKGHGLFTYFLLKGIKNEDVVKQDGSIAVSDLFSYLKPQVERIARKQYNNEQTPQLIRAKKD